MEALGGSTFVRSIPLEPIPHPDPGESVAELLSKANGVEGTAAPERTVQLGDTVGSFDEVAAAHGALGRFPGSQVMPLIRDFISKVP